ncbi:MAG TPA: nuclear transport factor 2 family protein [Pyrinomonadaceae bacterium]|nr:nuclear transport factor 2 family protein [Pyrinomonadaceae bacterium]
MRLLYLAAVLTVLVPGLGSAQGVKQKAAIEQEIKRLDVAHADAILRGDLAALDQLWTSDFKVNNPFNEIDRADRIRTGAVTYSSFIREPKSVLIHRDTVTVIGREIVVPKGNSPDAGKTVNRRYTNIWMKRSGKWRLVARHASVICQK